MVAYIGERVWNS